MSDQPHYRDALELINPSSITEQSTVGSLILEASTQQYGQWENTNALRHLISQCVDGETNTVTNLEMLVKILTVMENSLREGELLIGDVNAIIGHLPFNLEVDRFLVQFVIRNFADDTDNFRGPVLYTLKRFIQLMAFKNEYLMSDDSRNMKPMYPELEELFSSREFFIDLFNTVMAALPNIEAASRYYYPYEEYLSFIFNHENANITIHRRDIALAIKDIVQKRGLDVQRIMNVTVGDTFGVIFNPALNDWLEVNIGRFLEPHEIDFYLSEAA